MRRVGLLVSDTGGGHRAAARAIAAGLELRYPGDFSFDQIDFFREYTPPPWRYAPEIYPRWIRYSPRSYGVLLWWGGDVLMQGPLRFDVALRIMRPRFQRLFDEHSPDVLVILHGAFTRFAVVAREELGIGIPIVTVVTDLAKPHLGWYHPRVDRCLVPCVPAYRRGLAAGVPRERLRIVGHPAHPKFAMYGEDKERARRRLGWDDRVPAVLLLGGGEGMGNLEEIARAIDSAQTGVHLAVVCGRNGRLRERLASRSWRGPTDVYGFVEDMEVLMRAADLLVTKAGPGTIAEAAIIGLPMIVYGAIPLQETPNARYVVEHGAGLYARRPREIARLVARMFGTGDDTLLRLGIGVRRIARPDAVLEIADEIAMVTGVRPGSRQPNLPAR